MHGYIITLNVDCFDTVADLESKLTTCSLCPQNITLLYTGRPLRDHSKTLNYYSIQMGSTLDVIEGVLNLKFVHYGDVEVRVDYTIKQVKEDMSKKVDQALHFYPDKHRLVHDGVVLVDDRRLVDYNIVNDSMLDVIRDMVISLTYQSIEGFHWIYIVLI